MDLNDLRCPGCDGVIGTRMGAAWTTIWVWCAACQEMVQFDLTPAFTFSGRRVETEILTGIRFDGIPINLPARIAVEVQQPLPAGKLLGLSLPGLMTTSPIDLAPGDLVALDTEDGGIVSIWRAGRVIYMVPGRHGIEPGVGSDGLQANPLRNLR